MDYDCDIAVIGSGAGGGTLAAYCATMGKSVILIERGVPFAATFSASGEHDERATLIDKRPYDDRRIRFGSQFARTYMGSGPGGGTSVFGAAMVRPQAADFVPGRYYGNRIPAEIHEWPVEFESMTRWFDLAERLYQVADAPRSSQPAGSPSKLPGALSTDTPPESLPLAEVNEKLSSTAWQLGMNPQRLPLAIDAATCLRCHQCAGFVCPVGARRSSAQLVQEAITQGAQLQLRTGTEVHRIERSPGRVGGLWLTERAHQRRFFLRARRYVLAAGAVGSAAILLKSGFDHEQIGRNFMMHYSPLVTGLFPRATGAARTFVKQLMFTDFYYGTSGLPEKMGIVQSLPAPGPLLLAKNGFGWLPSAVRSFLRARILPLVGIVEDLPDPRNRVSLDPDGTISLTHAFSEFDRQRGVELSKQMAGLLKKSGAWYCDSGRTPSAEHIAHQCGTVRFGTSPEHAVLDPECRVFGFPDLSVADGSFMPVSLGVGPSLTIIANALRIADRLCTEV